jgi:hypothetical protein
MFLTILLYTSKLIITSLDKDNTVIDLKKEILKKIGKPMPLQKFYLNKLSGKTLDESKTLGENNVGDNTTLQLKVKMGHFGETQPKDNKVDLDINSFILDTINIEDIIFVSWGNYLSDQHRLLREYRSIKYNDWHDVFRQQLPLPLLQYASRVNKDISMYSIDQGFEQANYFDIRNILIKFVEPIIINKTELFKLNTCDLLNEIGIECPYTDSTISLYFMKYTYGYCYSNKGDFININLCLTELKDNLDQMGVEYYIYGQALDIETLITNNNEIGNDIKQWFHDNKIKQRGGGINPGRVITGENLNEHVGRVIRLIDTQSFSDRNRYQIKDLSGSKYIQDLSGFGGGLRFGILLEEDEGSNRYFAEDLEPYESLARLRYNNGRIYYFAVPKTFQDIRDHGVFPYYLELANVGLPPYDINPELPNTGPYSKYEPDHNHIFSAYQIRKKLTQKKKLRDAKQKLALSHIPDLDNQHLNLINSHLSNIERDPQLADRMATENYPKINGGNKLKNKKKTKKKMRGGDNLETIKEENCCKDLETCNYHNKRYQKLVDRITKLYEEELLKQMKGGTGTPDENLLGDDLQNLFNHEDTYLYPENPTVQTNQDELDEIDIYDMPIEFIKNVASKLNFNDCKELRNYCLINPGICALNRDFREKYGENIKLCKIEAKNNKSMKRFFEYTPDPKLIEDIIKPRNSIDKGVHVPFWIDDYAINIIRTELPFPYFAGEILIDILRQNGTLRQIQSERAVWGLIHVTFMDLIIFFHSQVNPEFLNNIMDEWIEKIINRKHDLNRALKNNYMKHPEPVEENWHWESQGFGRQWIYSKWLYETSIDDLYLLKKIFVDSMYDYLINDKAFHDDY